MRIRTSRNSTRLGAAAIVAVLLASLFTFVSPAGAAITSTERYGGADRYETAALAAIDNHTAGANQNIVLASGENFPDGLAGATLSGAANAPLLLTARNSLPASTANAIGVLGGATPGLVTVHILGGTHAISAAVEAQISGLGYKINRIGGATRYDTAANVAAAAKTIAGDGLFQGLRTAIVVTGQNFPDALSSGALAHAFNIPVILTTTASLSAQADAALTAGAIQKVFVIGGTAAVSAGVVTAIEAKGISVERLSGANRFGTAAALANKLGAEAIAGGAGWDRVEFTLAYGLNFPDALAAAQVAGLNQAPILLTSSVPTDTCNVLAANSATATKLFVMGGTAAISAETLTEATNCANVAAPTATITALDGRTSFTVQYSAQVINSTDTANYRLNNAALPGGSTVTAGAAGSNTVTVSLGGPTQLVPNDLITVNPAIQPVGARVQTAAGGLVPLTNFTVAADTTRPVVGLIRGYVGQNQAFVFLSEPATNLLGTGAVTATGVTTLAVSGLTGATSQAWLITFNAGPASGATINVAAGAFQDVSAAGNTNLAASAIVTTDATPPVPTSASYTTSPLANAAVSFTGTGDVDIFARSTGVANGHLGNAWTVTSVVSGSVQVQVNTTTRVIQIGAPDPTAIPVTDLVLALGANATFTANFTVVVAGAGTVNVPVAPTSFTGGTSTVRVAMAWSEQLRPIGVPAPATAPGAVSTLNHTSLVPAVGASTVNGGADAAAPFLGQWVISYTTPTNGPIAQFVSLAGGEVYDLAANGNGVHSVPITAG